MTPTQLVKEFEEFKTQTKARLDSYPIVNKENFKKTFKEIISETSRDQEKIVFLRSLQAITSIGFTIVVMLLSFIIFLLLFTAPA